MLFQDILWKGWINTIMACLSSGKCQFKSRFFRLILSFLSWAIIPSFLSLYFFLYVSVTAMTSATSTHVSQKNICLKAISSVTQCYSKSDRSVGQGVNQLCPRSKQHTQRSTWHDHCKGSNDVALSLACYSCCPSICCWVGKSGRLHHCRASAAPEGKEAVSHRGQRSVAFGPSVPWVLSTDTDSLHNHSYTE